MSVKLITQMAGDVTIIDARGKMTMGDGTRALREKIWELVEEGSTRILLNMAHVNYIDSTAIGELVAAHTTVSKVGGELKLLNVAQRVHDVLQISKLYSVFETFDDEAVALRSFSVARPVEHQAWR